MPFKWTIRTARAGAALTGSMIIVIALYATHESVDANERAQRVVNRMLQAPLFSSTDTPIQLTTAEIVKIGSRRMVERVGVSGELQPARRAVIRARASGKIIEMHAGDGHAVQAGNILVRFDTAELQSALLQKQSDKDAADAELTFATQALARTEHLVSRKVLSAEVLEKAKTNVEVKYSILQSLSAELEIARLALSNAEIRAPFSGIVTRRLADPGSTVSAEGELLTLVDTSVLDAKVLVSTRDIPRVSPGQTAELSVDGLENQTITGTVDRINPVAEDATRYVAVYVRLANSNGKLWGGMFATGSILIREINDVIAIPTDALRKDERGDYVLNVSTGHLRRQPVVVGASWSGGDLTEVASGLKAGETILVAPLPELQADMPVMIEKAG